MFCQRCGAEITGNFCSNCGMKIENSNNNSENIQMQYSNSIERNDNIYESPYTVDIDSQHSSNNNVQNDKKKIPLSSLSAFAFVFAFLGKLSVVGVIIAIIDLIQANNEKTPKKHTLTIPAIIIGTIMAIATIGVSGSDDSEQLEIDSNIEESASDSSSVDYSTDTAISIDDLYNIAAENKSSLSDEYVYITKEDLAKYYANMQGVKIYTEVTVTDLLDGDIQSTIIDGFLMTTFYGDEDFSKYQDILEGRNVTIAGTVGETTSYSIMGSTFDVKDCILVGVDENLDLATDNSLSEYMTMTEAVAKTSDSISEDDFKSLCETKNYEDILRNPDTYEDSYCKVTGSIDQIIEGLFGGYTIYIVDSSGNKWECYYIYADGESHVLEGDYVTLYGICEGTSTSTTVLGKQVTLPYITGKYIVR